ncbi:MAG: SDR family oxidoreductase [Pyrinomonadaceae bacterium]
MKVLILGANGMLGHKLAQVFENRFETYYTIREGFDTVERYSIFDRTRTLEKVNALDFSSVENAIRTTKPDVVINAIGIIKQLPSSRDVVKTLTVNSILPHLIGELAVDLGFRFVTLSTDCVFSGSRGNYSEADAPDALDLYGRSKQLGEVSGTNCLTIRTSIIGRELSTSHSLIEWFLAQTAAVKGYSNAIFSGFPTLILAELIAHIIERHPDLEGLFHVSTEPINKFDLLTLVRNRRGSDIEILEHPDFRIDRSLDSTLFRSLTRFEPLPWAELVDRMFSDPSPYDQWRKPVSL